LLRRLILVIIAALFTAGSARAQHGGSAPPVRTAPREVSQFNFLIGQWDLEVKPAAVGLAQKIHGVPKLVGTWKAWRALDGFGLEDELRVTDRSGNPILLSHAVRYYDSTARTWKSSTIDVYRGVWTSAIAQMRGAEMITSSRGTDAEGKPYLARGRYEDVKPDSFRFVQENSSDNGKTWSENLTIEAKRAAAAASH
jgi:hypothetical protein